MKYNKQGREVVLVILFSMLVLIFIMGVYAADPTAPDSINVTANETKGTGTGGLKINISGGYIATMNISATIQNPRWKAFVGWVSGSFTLDDSGGSTIYDWSLATITGRVYATRNSTSVAWSSINCSNITYLETENSNMDHTSNDDNITKTFENRTHNSFWVGSTFILANTCPTVKTYVNGVVQFADFHETALYDGYNHVYATILEDNATGYDGAGYDFQLLVPENGAPNFTSSTSYYLYVEIGT
ncbi:hypothetical protein GOV14_05225 [Candidatus Pacearchaeota archaeon]|nr:hypothetical protein [Candidatus Pacearchaeota archaeon]